MKQFALPNGIRKIVYDSRKADGDSLFVCLVGAAADGHNYAAGAYRSGCRHFMCERPVELPSDANQYIVPDTRVGLAEISAEFFGYPADKLRIIGITGTKGKTSTATFIYDILNNAGIKTGFIGTTGIIIDGVRTPTVNSTPESYELHAAFSRMLESNCKCAVMEVSSQAYKMSRVHGITFDIGLFTNLSPDHIGKGEHENFEEYRSCKARLFENSKTGIFNADDENSDYMEAHESGKVLTFGFNNAAADCKGSGITLWKSSSSLGTSFTYRGKCVSVKIPGSFSAYNALGAAAVCDAMGVDLDTMINTLGESKVKGRFELVDSLPYATLIIDYAHNGLSLETILKTLRQYDPERLICMFGAVGGRTELRRADMAAAASEFCDFCVITTDNPDNEDPLKIIADIEASMTVPYISIADREEAIKYTVANAEKGDVILFAGKGHEDYQIINGVHVPFNERELIEKYSALQLTQLTK